MNTKTKVKPYANMGYSESEFQLVRSSVHQSRQAVFAKWEAAKEGPEKAFYSERVDAYDALLAKYDRVLAGDTSQDANPDDYPEEEEG